MTLFRLTGHQSSCDLRKLINQAAKTDGLVLLLYAGYQGHPGCTDETCWVDAVQVPAQRSTIRGNKNGKQARIHPIMQTFPDPMRPTRMRTT